MDYSYTGQCLLRRASTRLVPFLFITVGLEQLSASLPCADHGESPRYGHPWTGHPSGPTSAGFHTVSARQIAFFSTTRSVSSRSSAPESRKEHPRVIARCNLLSVGKLAEPAIRHRPAGCPGDWEARRFALAVDGWVVFLQMPPDGDCGHGADIAIFAHLWWVLPVSFRPVARKDLEKQSVDGQASIGSK